MLSHFTKLCKSAKIFVMLAIFFLSSQKILVFPKLYHFYLDNFKKCEFDKKLEKCYLYAMKQNQDVTLAGHRKPEKSFLLVYN